jgi:Arc/MetJ-type ribon-helix-helix transcriptional regulator
MDVYRKVDAMALTELEKITINMGPVDLGQIDLLVREGFYQNRTDFIRTAIRNQLNTHAEAVKQTVIRKELVLGLQHYTRRDLEALRTAGFGAGEHRRRRLPGAGPGDHRLLGGFGRLPSEPYRQGGAGEPQPINVKHIGEEKHV